MASNRVTAKMVSDASMACMKKFVPQDYERMVEAMENASPEEKRKHDAMCAEMATQLNMRLPG